MLDEQLAIGHVNLEFRDNLSRSYKCKSTRTDDRLAVQRVMLQRQNVALLMPNLQEAGALQENVLQLFAGEMPESRR